MQHVAQNSPDSFTRTFAYNSNVNTLNKITIGANDHTFVHDSVGNITQEGSNRHLEWTCGDKLRSFYIQANTEEFSKYAQYLYGAGGERVKKLVRQQGGAYQSTVYVDGVFEYRKEVDYINGDLIPNLTLGTWKIREENTGTKEQNLIHVAGAIIRLGDTMNDHTPAIKYTLSDHLGNSSTYLTHDTGAVINREEYYAFGGIER